MLQNINRRTRKVCDRISYAKSFIKRICGQLNFEHLKPNFDHFAHQLDGLIPGFRIIYKSS